MELKEMIAVMQAADNGEGIEFKERRNNTWIVSKEPLWNWIECNYRIKPKTQYEPFTAETFRPYRDRWIRHKQWDIRFLRSKAAFCIAAVR